MPPTSPIDGVIDAIRDWITRCGVSNVDLAQQAGVDEKTIRQASGENWNPTAGILRKLATLPPRGWQAGDPLPSEPKRKARAA